MANIVVLNISINIENIIIWVRFNEDNYETFFTVEEYFAWVNDGENSLIRFLTDCFGHMDEGLRDVTISSFISMLRNMIR